jgi:hypothetical protein
LPQYGISCPKVLRYTSRPARKNEVHGEDYYFLSQSLIESLPEKDFLVGPVRNMVQAFDLNELEYNLANNNLILIEIYPDLWPRLIKRLSERMEQQLITASVFMTAVNPVIIEKLHDPKEKAGYITSEVHKMLLFRNKDGLEDIKIRANAAAGEVLEALSAEGQKQYAKILYSAPEGPDGEDDWTREALPVGQAKMVIEEFIEFYKGLIN